MSVRNASIRRKLMLAILVTTGVSLALTCTAYISYTFVTQRRTMQENLGTLSRAVAINSTAALAFDNVDDAREVLSALQAEPHIQAAGLYDNRGRLFATYPPNLSPHALPAAPPADGFRFVGNRLVGVQPARQGSKRLGTLYLESDLGALAERLVSYSDMLLIMMALSFGVAYVLSRGLQRQISRPVLALSEVARAVSERQDFGVRAEPLSNDELGQLTETFNRMLDKIGEQHELLADSEQRVRAVLNAALSAAIVVDGRGRIADWNARAATLFGWSRAEAVGQDIEQLIIPSRLRGSDPAGRHPAPADLQASGQLFELMALRRDGAEFPTEISISQLRVGDEASYCWFITDITERKETEIRVQIQLNRLNLLHRITRAIGERQDLRSIFEVLVRSLENFLLIDFICVCLYDQESGTLTVSRVGGRNSNVVAALRIGEGSVIPIDQNGLSRCVQGHLVYEPGIGAVSFPFPQRLAAAGLRSLVFAPLLVESRVFGVLVSARLLAQGFSSTDCEFLQQLSEHAGLAAHQSQLYAELRRAYEDLRQTQHAILQQERLRALGQMASGIAHDINNAISPVALYTESLLEREPGLSASARRYLETIQRAVEDVAQTVLRMREFYRPRDNEMTLAPLNPNTLVQQVLDLTRARWSDMPQQRGVFIEMNTELGAELPPIMGIDNEIREALTNLIFNAVDAIPESGSITVCTGLATENPARVFIDVVDNGIGMDEDTRRRCLEPFFTTKGERGTGLGLAMVYGMVQRHSADIEVTSAPGTGTRIRLLFLAATPDHPPAREGAASQALKERLRVLVVDDDPLVINSLRDILEGDGHAVTCAEGGQQGIDTFRKALQGNQPFDIVITDLGMPYVDGRKVAAAVKAASDATPVIMLTGWGQRLVTENNVPAQVDRLLSKPPRLHELREALAACQALQAGVQTS